MLFPARPTLSQVRLNWNAPLAEGLVVWLPLTGYSIVDLARGLAFSKSAPAPTLTTDLLGPTWNFVQASPTYLLSSSTPLTAPPLTIAAWFNANAVTATRDIVSIASSVNATDGFNLQQRANVGVGARASDSGGPTAAVSSKVVVAGQWHLGVATFTSTVSRAAYIDGRNPGTSSTSKTPTGLDRVGIGANVGSTIATPFDGLISNVCIWNRVLNAAEIWQLYDPSTRWQLYDARRIFAVSLPSTFLVGDSGVGGESLGLSAAFTALDNGAGNDAPGEAASFALPDTVSGADLLSQLLAALSNTEVGTSSDAIGSAQVMASGADSGQGSDTPTNISNALSRTDTGAGNDVLSQVAALLSTLESGQGSDTPAGLSNALSVADSGQGAEGQTLTVTLTLTDTGAGVDSVIKALLLALTDSGTGVDSLGSATVTFTLPDAGAGAESQTVTVTFSLADPGSSAEALTLFTQTLVNLFETGVGSDTVLPPGVSVTLTDTVAGAETPALTVALTVLDVNKPTTEALTASIVAALLDSGTGLDSGTVQVVLSVGDQAGGGESLTLSLGLTVSDQGSGSEALQVAITLSLPDSGKGTEAASIPAILIALAEAGQGNDQIGGVTVTIPLTDTGKLGDVLSQVAATLALLDTAQGVETQMLYVAVVKLLKVTFAFVRRTVRFALTRRTMTFEFLGNEVG